MDIYGRHNYTIKNNPALVYILTAEELVEFTDKASYLEWVKSWKDFYRIFAIRQYLLRIDLSKPHSEYTGWEVSDKMMERHRNKLILRILLEARRVGKRLSWQMKQDSKVARQ